MLSLLRMPAQEAYCHANPDGPEAGLIAWIDNGDLVHRLHFDDGCLRDQQRAFIHGGLKPDTPESARAQHRIRIGQFGDQLDGPGLARHLTIDQHDATFLGVGGSVCLDKLQDRTSHALPTNQFKEGLRFVEIVALADVEVSPNGVTCETVVMVVLVPTRLPT